MKVNLENYEALLIDYLDGKLDPSVEKDLLAFMSRNPELKLELELLKESKFTEDSPIEKCDFSHLKKPAFAEVKDDFQQVLIAYVEKDLNQEEIKELDKNKVLYPELNKELDYYRQTKLIPDVQLVFENKKQLKKAVAATVIPLYYNWMRIAAIALFIGIGGLMLYKIQNKNYNAKTALSNREYTNPEPELKAKNPMLVQNGKNEKGVGKNDEIMLSQFRKPNSLSVKSDTKTILTEINSRGVNKLEIAELNREWRNPVPVKLNPYKVPTDQDAGAIVYLTPKDWVLNKIRQAFPAESVSIADTLINGGTKGVEAIAINLLNKTTGISYTQTKNENGDPARYAIVSKYFAFERTLGN